MPALLLTAACGAQPQTLEPIVDGPHEQELLAVEPGEARVWVAHRAGSRAHVTAVEVATGKETHVLDFTPARDPRVVFPGAGEALLIVGRDGSNTIVRIDTDRLAPAAVKTTPTQLWELRLSPSGRWLAALNFAQQGLPIPEVLDTHTLERTVLPHLPIEATEARWSHAHDELVTVNFDGNGMHPALYSRRFAAPFAVPDYDVETPGLEEPTWYQNYWRFPISVSPDDRWVGVGGEVRDVSSYALLFDQRTASLTKVPGLGPIAFSADSRTAFAFTFTDDGTPQLLVIPLDGGEAHAVPLPLGPGGSYPQMIIDDGGRHVVVASSAMEPKLAIYDVATGAVSSVARKGNLDIESHAYQPDGAALWLVDQARLFRLDLATARLDEIHPGFASAGVALLPGKGLLAVGALEAGELAFIDLATRKVVRRALLTAPNETSAPALTF